VCPPPRSDEPSGGARSVLGIGALMLLACVGGPVLAGAIGALGVGVLAGAGGLVAVALCVAAPALAPVWRRHSAGRLPSTKG
jgi:hypothetical protein